MQLLFQWVRLQLVNMKVVYSKITSLKTYKEQLKKLLMNMHVSQQLAIVEMAINNGLKFLGLR